MKRYRIVQTFGVLMDVLNLEVFFFKQFSQLFGQNVAFLYQTYPNSSVNKKKKEWMSAGIIFFLSWRYLGT